MDSQLLKSDSASLYKRVKKSRIPVAASDSGKQTGLMFALFSNSCFSKLEVSDI